METATDVDTTATVEAAARRDGKRAGEAERAPVERRNGQKYDDQCRRGKMNPFLCFGCGSDFSSLCVCVRAVGAQHHRESQKTGICMRALASP